jgi:hypothetical protein
VIAAVDQNREELILGPTAHEIAGPKSILHGLSNYAQNCITRGRAVGGSKVRQAIDLNEDDAEWELVAREAGQIFPQVEMSELMIGDAGAFVHTAMLGQGVTVAVSLCAKALFVKTLRDAQDRAVGIAQGSKPHQHMHGMTFFVAQLHLPFLGLALVQGSPDGTSCAAGDTTLIVTLWQNVVPAGAPHDLMPLVPGKPFGALVPEQDFPVSIRHRHTRLQTVQDSSE